MTRITRLLVLAATLLALAVALPTGGGASNAMTYSGQAYALKATLPVIGTNYVADTTYFNQNAPFANHACVFSYPNGSDCLLGNLVPDVTNGGVSASLLSSRTVGQGGQSHSSSSLADLSVNLAQVTGVQGLPTITANALHSDAHAVCKAGSASVTSTSQLADLAIGPVNPLLNTETDVTVDGTRTITIYDLAGNQVAQIIVNKTSSSGSGSQYAQTTVEALHITASTPVGPVEIVIGYAHADIGCANPAPPVAGCDDKLTGGGWYDLTGRDHFAIAARANDGTWGHLLYMDKASGLKFMGKPDHAFLFGPGKVIGATPYSNQITLANAFQGAAVVTGRNKEDTGRFIAVAVDNGEGANAVVPDMFGIVIIWDNGSVYESGATASAGVLGSFLGQQLGGGNIQYHSCK